MSRFQFIYTGCKCFTTNTTFVVWQLFLRTRTIKMNIRALPRLCRGEVMAASCLLSCPDEMQIHRLDLTPASYSRPHYCFRQTLEPPPLPSFSTFGVDGLPVCVNEFVIHADDTSDLSHHKFKAVPVHFGLVAAALRFSLDIQILCIG